MENLICSEWVPVSKLMKALRELMSSLLFCILLMIIIFGVAVQYPFLIVVLASILAFVLFLFWNYRGIEIKVTSNKLLVHYGFFNHKRIPIEDIVSCKRTKASFIRYGGMGVRYGIDGSWAYTTSLGDAVRVIPRRGRAFVFSSSNPEEICSIIGKIRTKSKSCLL